MSDVINMFERKPKEKTKKIKAKRQDDGGEFDFSQIMEQNQKNSDRQKSDRAKDNKSVTRSYRLKN